MDLYQELMSFQQSLKEYKNLLGQLSLNQPIPDSYQNNRESLLLDSSRLIPQIKRLTGRDESLVIYEMGKPRSIDMWEMGLRNEYDYRTVEALDACTDYTLRAIGKLKSDIDDGVRDEQGKLIVEPAELSSEPPKAFIAHGGDSPALRNLKSFLEALGVQPLIVEEQPSEGRSVGENVDWYSRQADCAIILATKGDIDGKTGGFIPRGNVLMEIGKLQELFKDRIIYLLQAGTKFPTNVSEKVWGRFTSSQMDNAFIKIAKELKKFGILRATKPQE